MEIITIALLVSHSTVYKRCEKYISSRHIME